MKKLFKVLYLILAINLFSDSQSNAWELPASTTTYKNGLAKIVSILYKSGTNIGSFAFKDSKNLINNKMIPFVINNDYLLATSIMLSIAYTVYLVNSPKSTVKKSFKYGLSPIWYPTYLAWRKLRQEYKIASLAKRLKMANKVNRGDA